MAGAWSLPYLIQVFMSCRRSTLIGAGLRPGAEESSGPGAGSGATRNVITYIKIGRLFCDNKNQKS